jgi:hypothetical protein
MEQQEEGSLNMQKRMETAVKRTSDRIIPVAMPKYQRGQEI